MTKPIADSPDARAGAGRQPIARRSRRWWAFTIVLLLAMGYGLWAAPAWAQLNTGLDFGTATGLSTQDIRVTIAKIIRAFLGLLGIMAVAIVAYGGFLWMTSGGNEEQLGNAKKWLTNGAIGLTIILLSFSITQFVLSRLLQAGSGGGAVTTAGGFSEDVFLTGALGSGPIESHFPTRGAQDVARNTRIFITFREAIDPASLASDTNANGTIGTTGGIVTQFDNYQDLALAEAIQVAPIGTNIDPTVLTPLARQQNAAVFTAEAQKLTPMGVAISADGRTVVLSPVVLEGGRVKTTASGFAERSLLGTPSAPTAYLVRITGAVKKASMRAGVHEDLFIGAFRDGYTWDFTVSTTVDLTPPKITSVVPFPDADGDAVGEDGSVTIRGNPDQPRNVTVQVNFNEAVDPTVTAGTFTPGSATATFRHLAVSTDETDTGRVAGTFTISNQYRTVEFKTTDPCGQNSCGGTVYCLPGNVQLHAWANAARLEAGGPTSEPFSGVMDAAGNSLDGNGNGRAEGPGAPGTRRFAIGDGAGNAGASDSAAWTFHTNDTLDLTVPVIREVVHYGKQDQRIVATTAPVAQGGGTLADLNDISLTRPVEILFSKLMSGSVASGLGLTEGARCDEQTGQGCLWFTGLAAHEDTDTPIPKDTRVDATRVTVAHAPFREARAGFPVPEYRVRTDASVKDIYQNCFYSVDAPVGPQGPHGGLSCIGPGTDACTQIP
ncbi:hypothetical protein HY480_02305 [Candidatus Uhrbacteria bacterium]|nr:hypothetical protein [Candidatus Uhrbacteria bacterium]